MTVEWKTGLVDESFSGCSHEADLFWVVAGRWWDGLGRRVGPRWALLIQDDPQILHTQQRSQPKKRRKGRWNTHSFCGWWVSGCGHHIKCAPTHLECTQFSHLLLLSNNNAGTISLTQYYHISATATSPIMALLKHIIPSTWVIGDVTTGQLLLLELETKDILL